MSEKFDWFESAIGDYHLTNENDFTDSEGYLVCGVCGERKEALAAPFEYLGKKFGGFVTRRDCLCDRQNKERLKFEKRLEYEHERKMAPVREMQQYSLVDQRFFESTFDQFKPQTPADTRIFNICQYYVEHFDVMKKNGEGLLFYGSVGTGKTFAANCIANALMEKGIPVLVTSIVRLTAGKFGDELNELLTKMNEADLLVLDDLGTERNTEYKAEQVFSVIDTRYSARKPMIITTNLPTFETNDIQRKRVFDRIQETCKPVMFSGKSKRMTAGKNMSSELWAGLEG